MTQPSKDFQTRLQTAKQWRSSWEGLIKEVFHHCAPHRELDFGLKEYRTPVEAQTYHSLPEELAVDLASDLVTFFTPPEAKWCSYQVTGEVRREFRTAVKDLVREREDKLFSLIKTSNYDDVAPQWAFEASSHGTPALWVQHGHASQPIYAEVVTPDELLITPGPFGILDRFRQSRQPASALPALFAKELALGQVSFDPEIDRRIKTPGKSVDVMWGFWVDWADPMRPMWKMEVTVDGKAIGPARIIGDLAGSCPLLVGRFNPTPRLPWGRGPGMKALPDLRTLDKLEEILLTAAEDMLESTIIYPDDGFLDLSDGLTMGHAYPASRGFTRDQIYEFAKTTRPEYGWTTRENYEERLRAAFYQDGPRQRGDTPPTASQWIDERRRVQQRLGKPSAPLWSEMLYPFVQRVEQLAVETGEMDEAITHRGEVISVRPITPLQKAQNQDQVMASKANLELAFSVFGEATPQIIDGVETFTRIVDASGDELTQIVKGGGDGPAA